MLFNSLTFVLFFACVVTLHYAMRSATNQKAVLLTASYLFYAAWNPVFIILLWFSTILDWWLALRIDRSRAPRQRHTLLIISIAANLSILGYFKYGEFLLNNFTSFLGTFGIAYQPPAWEIVLPIGISFYTFQSLSYTVDVYRRRLPASRSLLDYSLFVAFFPQLVAGPIVRATDFLPQLERRRLATLDQFGWGLTLLCFGMFAKIVLADNVMAPIVDTVYAAPARAAQIEAWVAVFAFSGQIFFDFSGYANCAVGAALCLGYHLPNNFRAPYAARGFSDFWRRWHISLSAWLRDYLYISLGGNQRSNVRTLANLMITMLIGGLWHGSSWMFVLWGGLHGLYLIAERGARTLAAHAALQPNALLEFLGTMITFVGVSVAWILFRAHNMEAAYAMFDALAGNGSSVVLDRDSVLPTVLVIMGLLAWHWGTRYRTLEEVFDKTPGWARVGVLSGSILCIVFSPGPGNAFIYFQF